MLDGEPLGNVFLMSKLLKLLVGVVFRKVLGV